MAGVEIEKQALYVNEMENARNFSALKSNINLNVLYCVCAMCVVCAVHLIPSYM